MKTVIVTTSRSRHTNTRRIADAIAAPLDARVVGPDDVTPSLLDGVDLIGLGSGVYWWRLDDVLLDVVRRLPAGPRYAFVFGTSGRPSPTDPTARLQALLRKRGLTVEGSFVCRGIDTWGPFRLVGGVARHHPDSGDLAAARTFGSHLRG